MDTLGSRGKRVPFKIIQARQGWERLGVEFVSTMYIPSFPSGEYIDGRNGQIAAG